ncbi:MAG TPA: cupin domain-containing protein [Terriglobales bacterium]|nr:cupin domain-containing protein [Terriglobales bacterium]
MARHKHVIHLSEVPVEPINAPAGSHFAGRRQRVGARIGANKLGYSFFTVPPGKAAFPYHAHSANEEMIYIIDGEGILRFGEEEVPVRAGTLVACPSGDTYAHQLVNTGAADLRYLVVSTMAFPDICEYPDSNKIGAYATGNVGPNVGVRALFVKNAKVDYYDGEDGKEIERLAKTRGDRASK